MKIISLSLTGFKGIRDGLGRDSITLDFAHLAGDAQLVAIKGPNGRGKSTILDNMHPYPVMPSRAGADGLGAFSFYDQVVLPESGKTLEWEHAGRRYRSQLVFRVNGKKKTEAYLHVQEGGTWRPFQTADGTLSDGKVDTYKRCVEEIVGSQETFFTSAFSAQGKRPLMAFRAGEIKSLMADLLGHEEIRKIGAQAAQTTKLLNVGLAGIRQELASLQTEEGQLVVRRAALGDPKARIAHAASGRTQAGAGLDTAKAALATARVEVQGAAQIEARRQQLTDEQRALVSDGRTALDQIDQRLERERRLGAELELRVASRVQAALARRQVLEAQKVRLTKTTGAAAAVAWAARRLAVSETIVGQRAQRLEERRATIERISALATAEAAGQKELANIEREAGQATLRAKELGKRFGLTNEVPCAGSDLQGKCRLLDDAMQAKPLMPSADLEIGRLQEKKQKEEEHLKDIQAELANHLAQARASSLAMAKVSLGVLEGKLAMARARASSLSILAARRGEIEQARVSLDAVSAELVTLATADHGETADERAERNRIAESLKALEEQRGGEAGKYRKRYDDLGKLLAALPQPTDGMVLQRAEQAVAAAQSAAEAAERAYLAAVRDEEAAASLDARLVEIRTQLQSAQGRADHVERGLSRWNLFARCMSNDGLIALLIDDAGPTLAALANDLLLACHGPRFTVSILTQMQTDKGDVREGFDIVVFDADTGSSKSVRDRGGGQRVWINECMVRAIALYLAQNSGRRYETLFCDEADGPLDPEHKRIFMAMKREVLRIGGYGQEFFISQTPELTAMADAVIDLDQFVEHGATAGAEAA